MGWGDWGWGSWELGVWSVECGVWNWLAARGPSVAAVREAWFPAFAGMTGGGVGRRGGVSGGSLELGWRPERRRLRWGDVVSGFRRNDGGWVGGVGELGVWSVELVGGQRTVGGGVGGAWFPAFAGMTGGGAVGWVGAGRSGGVAGRSDGDWRGAAGVCRRGCGGGLPQGVRRGFTAEGAGGAGVLTVKGAPGWGALLVRGWLERLGVGWPLLGWRGGCFELGGG